MKRFAALSLVLASQLAQADCKPPLPLTGMLFVETCAEESAECRPASELLHAYSSAGEDDPATMSIAIQTSPWRLYGPDFRILRVPEVATKVRAHLDEGEKSVRLQGSWTGVAPDANRKSLAQQLSEALDGFPVTGLDGFMWVSPKGEVRTTRQAFTMRKGAGPYLARKDQDVMASLVAGWPSEMQDHFEKEGNAQGVMRAGVGWDVYMLCPDSALAAFELAAEMGSPIAAYNAAVMRLERAGEADMEAAIKLLERAVELNDAQAGKLIEELNESLSESKPAD